MHGCPLRFFFFFWAQFVSICCIVCKGFLKAIATSTYWDHMYKNYVHLLEKIAFISERQERLHSNRSLFFFEKVAFWCNFWRWYIKFFLLHGPKIYLEYVAPNWPKCQFTLWEWENYTHQKMNEIHQQQQKRPNAFT